MDKNTITAFILIALIIIITPYYMEMVAPPPTGPPVERETVSSPEDNTIPTREKQSAAEVRSETAPAGPKDVATVPLPEEAKERVYIISTDLYEAVVSNQNGGSFLSFKLHKYSMFDSSLVNLIDAKNRSNLVLSGRTIDGDDFRLDHHWQASSKEGTYQVDDGSLSLSFETRFLDEKIIKTLTFFPDSYRVNVDVDMSFLEPELSQGLYDLSWWGGMPITEKSRKDDLFYFKGYVFQGDELFTPKMKDDKPLSESYLGQTAWVAVRSKYFLSALIPQSAAVGAVVFGQYDDMNVPRYNVALTLKADNATSTTLYFGPLEYNRIKALGHDVDQAMTMGWSVIRPISRGVLFLLTSMHKYIPNYGFILILFSILVKIVVYPLTKKSYQSTRKMQEVQPQLQALKEKYKNNPQQLNKATMEMYKEMGVNPLGGCLPLLLQMPLLIALFQVFRSTIELRGAPFILWIKDLSAPDTLVEIAGFPLNVLPVVMAVTMIVQQSMMPTQPGQNKSMMYVMNVVLLFVFYRFPSGLNLYYTLFNILTILQQKYLTPHTPAPVTVKNTSPPRK